MEELLEGVGYFLGLSSTEVVGGAGFSLGCGESVAVYDVVDVGEVACSFEVSDVDLCGEGFVGFALCDLFCEAGEYELAGLSGPGVVEGSEPDNVHVCGGFFDGVGVFWG